MLYNKNSYLYTMIGKNEKVLWQGKSDKLCSILKGIINRELIVVIIWTFVLIEKFEFFVSMGAQFPKESVFLLFFIFYLVAVLAPFYLFLRAFISSYMTYKHAEYLITDKAVYVSGGVFSITYEQKSFAELSHVNVYKGIIEEFLDVGDVILTRKKHGRNKIMANSKYGDITISGISDYKEVYDLVEKLQKDIQAESNASK